MLYLTCTTITSVDLAHYGVSRAKDWASVDCGSNKPYYAFNVLVTFQNIPTYGFDVHIIQCFSTLLLLSM